MPKTNGSQLQVDKIHWIGGRPMFKPRTLHDRCEELLLILDSGMDFLELKAGFSVTRYYRDREQE